MRVRSSVEEPARRHIRPDSKVIRKMTPVQTLRTGNFTLNELRTMRLFVENCGREVPKDPKQLVIAARECLLEIEAKHSGSS
jgi:hypothetical protein